MRELVEQWYSNAAYPIIQMVVTTISNLLPVAVLDLLSLAAVSALAIVWWRAVRTTPGRARALGRAAGLTGVALVCVYVAFQLLWGLNYQRLRLVSKLVLEKPVPSADAVVELGKEAAERLNALRARAHAEGWQEPVWKSASLLRASAEVQQLLGAVRIAVPGRLKHSMFGPVFRWNGVDGMVNPLGLEVLANPDLLPFERPFVTAHEWAHLAGYAEESEANFVGWLTCLKANVASQYSGWLYLYWQIVGELPPADGAQVAEGLASGPRADLDAITERLRRGEWPLLRRASWAAYDQYLKANAVPSGVRSYGEVVTLILRARFEDGWRPVRREASAPAR